MTRPVLFALLALGLTTTGAADPPKLELKDGDRIVYLGNTFVERDASYGYLETMLTISHPEINFTFRNLGWSGDTVWGDARARFGTREDGFKHLKEDVFSLKPTIILVAYGMNESFAGEAGLPDFEKGLNKLLDTLAETKAKIVLISPIPHQKLPPPLPDPTKHNVDLRLYRDTLASTAKERNLVFVDLLTVLESKAVSRTQKFQNLTSDGVQPTATGLFALGDEIARRAFDLHLSVSSMLKLDKNGGAALTGKIHPIEINRLPQSVRIAGLADTLPWPAVPTYLDPPNAPFIGGHYFNIETPDFANYLLRIDGGAALKFYRPKNRPSASATILDGPEIEQVEKLRGLVNKKNELFFNRWRPENETYLYLFRKHEQGNNAVEIPQFDPLIAGLEAEINKLKKPVKHTYEIIREDAGK